jgi:hypothetical protein
MGIANVLRSVAQYLAYGHLLHKASERRYPVCGICKYNFSNFFSCMYGQFVVVFFHFIQFFFPCMYGQFVAAAAVVFFQWFQKARTHATKIIQAYWNQ